MTTTAVVAVRYLPPTNTKGSRLKVWVRGFRPLTYSYYAMDNYPGESAFEAAARNAYVTIHPTAIFKVRPIGNPYDTTNEDSLVLIETA